MQYVVWEKCNAIVNVMQVECLFRRWSFSEKNEQQNVPYATYAGSRQTQKEIRTIIYGRILFVRPATRLCKSILPAMHLILSWLKNWFPKNGPITAHHIYVAIFFFFGTHSYHSIIERSLLFRRLKDKRSCQPKTGLNTVDAFNNGTFNWANVD